MKKFLTVLIIIGIMIFVTVVTVYMAYTQSITLDESQTIFQALMPLSTLVPFIGADVAAPSYLLIVHFWMQFFGTNLVYLRFLSIGFLLISLPILYKVYREAGGRKIALLATGLFSLSPFVLWYGFIARDYTLFILATALNSLYFLRMMRSNGKEGKLGYFLSTLLGYYTHYFYIFFIFSQCVYVIWRLIVRVTRDPRFGKVNIFKLIWKDRQPALTFFTTWFATTLLFLPWVFYFLHLGSATNTQPLIAPPSTYNVFLTFSNFIFGFQPNGLQALIISLWPLAAVGLFFVFTRRTRILVADLFYFVFATFFPVFFIFLVSYIKPIFLSRYLIFVIPTLFFVIAWILLSYPKRIASFLIAFFAIVMICLLSYQTISNDSPIKENYVGVDNYLEQHATPNDIIAVTSPFTIYPIEYDYNGYASINSIPLWNIYTSGAIPKFSVANLSAQMKQYTAEYNNVYIVLSYDQGYQSDIINYMDTHYKREKLIDFTPGLELREYKLRYSK